MSRPSSSATAATTTQRLTWRPRDSPPPTQPKSPDFNQQYRQQTCLYRQWCTFTISYYLLWCKRDRTRYPLHVSTIPATLKMSIQ